MTRKTGTRKTNRKEEVPTWTTRSADPAEDENEQRVKEQDPCQHVQRTPS